MFSAGIQPLHTTLNPKPTTPADGRVQHTQSKDGKRQLQVNDTQMPKGIKITHRNKEEYWDAHVSCTYGTVLTRIIEF